MATVVETSRTTTSTLGRFSEQTEVYAEGASTSTKNEQTIVKAEARPEMVATKASPVHVGVAFEFTLSWQGRGGKA